MMPADTTKYASIRDVQKAIHDGQTNVRNVAEYYMKNAKNVNPELNAYTAFNEHFFDEAEELDRIGSTRPGPLHGVVIALKDNIETAGIPTAYGSAACKDHIPPEDATIVRRLKEAGAIIIGKTAMPDWAASFFSTSSRSGTTANPHDRSRDTGGSSAGSGAAVAADTTMAAIGGDTWGSIRLPSSYCGLVGVRLTPGRISSDGMSPLLAKQDTAGPMARTVEDAARILDVLVGFDEKVEATSVNAMVPSRGLQPFQSSIENATLAGKKLGVLREVFGSDTGIIRTVDNALEKFRQAGAEIVEISVPKLEYYKDNTFFHYVSKSDINGFLTSRPELAHVTVQDLHAKGIYHKVQDHIDLLVQAPDDPTTLPTYARQLLIQQQFRNAVASQFAKHHLDAMLYPTSQILAPKTQDVLDMKVDTIHFPTNTVIASQLHFPAMSVPIGTISVNDGSSKLPIGLEILGLPLRDEDLVAVGAGVEVAMKGVAS